MKIAKLPRVLILLLCTAGLPACSLLRVAGPCYGYGCPAGTPHEPPKVATSAPEQAPAAANVQPQDSTRDSANQAQTKSADETSHKHGLLSKLHLTHGD
jgi:hypothetical protein